MSDTRSRALERAATSGSVEDQARALVARLRAAPGCERCDGHGKRWLVGNGWNKTSFADPSDAGVMREESCAPCAGTGSPLRARVDLAAYCGDEAAIEVLGAPLVAALLAPVVGQTARAYLDHQALGALVGQINAGARPSTFSPWLAGLSRWADVGPAPGWVLRRAAAAAAREAQHHAPCCPNHDNPAEPEFMEGCPRWDAAARALEADEAWLACPCEEHWSALHVAYVEAGHLAWLPAPWTTPDVTRTVESIAAAAQLAGEDRVRDAIRSSLAEWALGGSS
jgi:hypothetical protein